MFYTPNNLIRPVRLNEDTRRFAYESLHYKYGMDTQKVPAVCLDDVENFGELSAIEKYDAAIARIAAEAPIRICEGERISGAATLGWAINHKVPASYDGNSVFDSISHLTLDFETVLKKGVDYIRETAEKAYSFHKGTERESFAKSCLNCLDAFSVWHERYLEVLDGRPECADNYKNLTRVPWEPATSFYEAVQSLWFVFAFTRLCGNWPGIGRLDWLLGDYLKKDLENGTLTLDEAREILAHFFIKGCEWIYGDRARGSGDAQHYQNIVLSGIDGEGRDVTNEVTYLVLDILEELGISDFPTTVRLNRNTDEALLRRVAEVMRYGGGILAVYNEDIVLETLIKDGYPKDEAWKFANDGCWEVQIPGKTYFIYAPFDGLSPFQMKTMKEYGEPLEYKSFDELYSAYISDLSDALEKILQSKNKVFTHEIDAASGWKWKSTLPCTVVSLFEQGCIEKGLSYLEGGPVYNVYSLHIGGIADVANSMYVIKKLVFDEKKLTLNELVRILKNNWEGEEALRQYAFNKYTYYGNDNDEVDGIVARVLSDFSDICKGMNGRSGYHINSGVSTFGRQLNWSKQRLATPHGRKAGDILAGNCSPTPGSDKEGATAIIRSYCKIDHTKLATGAALDIKLLPTSVAGEDGLEALISLLRGFVILGGFFMQPDVADAEILKAARENPQDYRTLSVRVSGWNARFITLDDEWQRMVIEQNGGTL